MSNNGHFVISHFQLFFTFVRMTVTCWSGGSENETESSPQKKNLPPKPKYIATVSGPNFGERKKVEGVKEGGLGNYDVRITMGKKGKEW